MKSTLAFVTISVSAMGLMGCSEGFMPLPSSYSVSVGVTGFNKPGPTGEDGKPQFGYIEMCLIKDEKSDCGRRAVDSGYDDDEYVLAVSGVGSGQIPCRDFGPPDDSGFTPARCSTFIGGAPPGSEATFTFNDLEGSKVTMPPYAVLTSPKDGDVFSMAAGSGIALAWDAMDSGDDLQWLWKRASDDEPCTGIIGDGDSLKDSGSFLIPSDRLPKPSDLPAEGCPVDVTLIRNRDGTMGAGLDGFISGSEEYSVTVTMKP